MTSRGVEALKCHQCTSYESTQCGDPFFFDDGIPRSGDKYLKECPADDGNTYTLCRKMFQNVKGDERIVRSCGWEESVSPFTGKQNSYKYIFSLYPNFPSNTLSDKHMVCTYFHLYGPHDKICKFSRVLLIQI